MIKQLFLFFSLVLSSSLFAQKHSDLKKISDELESRIPDSWQVQMDKGAIQLMYISKEGLYEIGCCSAGIQVPEDDKLLDWLRNDYLDDISSLFELSDTLKIEITFAPTWSQAEIDSVKAFQDSLKLYSQERKVMYCRNYFWTSTSDKQVIPFYSKRFDCAVFFERPEGFTGIYELEKIYDIPDLVNIDDKILMIQQIAALLLEIDETCFTCSCKEE